MGLSNILTMKYMYMMKITQRPIVCTQLDIYTLVHITVQSMEKMNLVSKLSPFW